MIKWSILLLCLVGIVTSAITTEAGVVLPRMGAFIELDKVTPPDPWEDRSSRIQWVLARLNCEGLRVFLLDPQSPTSGCEVIYLDGLAFTGILARVKEGPIGILQSGDRKLVEEDPTDRVVQASPRVSLKFHKRGSRRVVTVFPDLADCFNDDGAVRELAGAILWLAGLPEDTPRVAPFPNGKRSTVMFIVHGEGNPENIPEFQRQFSRGPGALTYAVSEDALSRYPAAVRAFIEARLHEVAIHNHGFTEHGTEDKVLSANIHLHQKTLEGSMPAGLIGPYLEYFDDFREALTRYHFRWFLDKDLPYPLNIPAPADAEPIIDITESLKPYDGWWNLQEAEALWRLGLRWKRLRNEIAVCSWHDNLMGKEPTLFLEFMRYVKTLPDVWQTTALDFQSFWRDRWRSHVEIVSNDDRTITLRLSQAPAGLTLLRRRNGKTEMALLAEGNSMSARLEWKPMQSIEDRQGPEGGTERGADGIKVKWGLSGVTYPRQNDLGTEFAVINTGQKMVQNETITLSLPEELKSRIRRALPVTLRVSTYGVKGLKFKDIKEILITKDMSVPATISFHVDSLRGQSIQFYRLRSPLIKKAGHLDRWQRSLRKHPIYAAGVTAAAAALALILVLFFTRRNLFLRRVRQK